MDKFDKYFLAVARLTAGLSYCKRLQVGAVAVRERRIICVGYNGTLPGQDNCCEELRNGRITTKDETEHAERNLVAYAARNGIALAGCELYITHTPCVECAKVIANAGFIRVYAAEFYRSNAGIELLERLGVECLVF